MMFRSCLALCFGLSISCKTPASEAPRPPTETKSEAPLPEADPAPAERVVSAAKGSLLEHFLKFSASDTPESVEQRLNDLGLCSVIETHKGLLSCRTSAFSPFERTSYMFGPNGLHSVRLKLLEFMSFERLATYEADLRTMVDGIGDLSELSEPWSLENARSRLDRPDREIAVFTMFRGAIAEGHFGCKVIAFKQKGKRGFGLSVVWRPAKP